MTTLKIRVGIGDTTLAETTMRAESKGGEAVTALAELTLVKIVEALKQDGFIPEHGGRQRTLKIMAKLKRDAQRYDHAYHGIVRCSWQAKQRRHYSWQIGRRDVSELEAREFIAEERACASQDMTAPFLFQTRHDFE